MASIERFEDIVAWQKSKILTVEIYSHFKTHRDFGFRDQIQRASVSIMNNIAEGFERRSNKEFIYFLYIAKGSCGEVRSMLSLGVDLGHFSEEQYLNLSKQSEEISRVLAGLIKSLKK